MTKLSRTYIESPQGYWLIEGSASGLSLIRPTSFAGEPQVGSPGGWDVVRQAAGELSEYFAGKRLAFHLPLAGVTSESPFAEKVWQAVLRVPCGMTASYGAIARQAGSPGGARAVGQILHRNPLAIVRPCHRVILASGSLGGFAFGTDLKDWLLGHEASFF